MPLREEDDFVAWHYEKTGVFTVKSAYKLGYSLAHENRLNIGRSLGDGKSRNLWKLIWKAPVPNKIRMFAWRLADDNLPTKKNKWKRTLEVDSTCNICGVEEEDSHHATINCTKAKALRNQLRKIWKIPAEDMFRKTGPDWLILMLANTPKDCHAQIILMLWRDWHLRNDIIHEKGKATISDSVAFLQNYLETLYIKDNIPLCDKKGKRPMFVETRFHSKSDAGCDGGGSNDIKHVWIPPEKGTLKINVDASFLQESGIASTGIIIRNHTGEVILATGHMVERCTNAEEAEAYACLDGLRLATEWAQQPFTLETDSLLTANNIKNISAKYSKFGGIYQDIHEVWTDCGKCIIRKINRDQNCAAHEIAKFIRKNTSQGSWLTSLPPSVIHVIEQDCIGTAISHE